MNILRTKIVVFQGGLGNQLFQYAFLCKLKEDGYHPLYLNNAVKSHNGFEIQRYFETNMNSCSKFVQFLYRQVLHLEQKTGLSLISNETKFSLHKFFQSGYWQDVRFMPSDLSIHFKKIDISEKNRDVEKLMLSTNSVSIHVRRGDYLLPPHNKVFAGICTEDYYRQALETVSRQTENPRFFVFSDDMDWTKEHLPVPNDNCIYIDWNTGDNSIFDMYLMSKCKANILANSTFSYWGARLSGNKCVVYPGKWFNTMPAPQIFPKEWIKI